MEARDLYIIVSIAVLLVIGVLSFAGRNKKKRLTPMTGLAFSFVIAGIIFGDSRIIGYSLIGTGIILAVIDIIKRSKTGNK